MNIGYNELSPMLPDRPSVPAGARILMLASDGHGSGGGIAQYNVDLLAAMSTLASVGSVTVVPRLAREPLPQLPPKICYDLAGLGSVARYVLATLNRIRKGKYDAVWCAHINLVALAYLAARLRGVPLILAIYGIDVWKPTRSRLANRLAARADLVVSISQVTHERFAAWCKIQANRTVIMPNAITLGDYGEGPRAPDLVARYELEGRPVVMTFGRLVGRDRAKGFDEILAILPRLIEKAPRLIYIIAGSGPDSDRLAGLAKNLGVADHVRFTGFVPENRKADYYRLSDVYAMPSRGEGFGFVILEAMACGIPAIASSVDGGREAVLGGQLGRVVDPDDPEALESAVLAALAEPKGVPPGLDYFEHSAFTRRLGDAFALLGMEGT
ncbi:glycosyltransferase family 4 protein [Sphingomonas sp. AR_OL41]|uniref:glycosyltransferase family 4 protein n=1 Tax=Sphingomonas sp. AR_OL41 TaxID=3042729 RepID=UPI0024812A4B|nr:glycosyltransferase family 4 protein [Sphingomonas sp. AR_OL41]MDH7974950.1 glycosyltransferase family 4 protein [Sphingomonas sp. AR_OL41]